MKTTSPNLDFWDEPLPAAGVRRLLRNGLAARLERMALAAPARRRLRRNWSVVQTPLSRSLRRAGKR